MVDIVFLIFEEQNETTDPQIQDDNSTSASVKLYLIGFKNTKIITKSHNAPN